MHLTRIPKFTIYAIIGLSAVLYLSLWSAPFLSWDDDSNISGNPYFKSGDWGVFWRAPYFGLYVPVTSWLWELLYRAGGGSPVPYRILNPLLHALNVALAFLVLKRLARQWQITSAGALILGLTFFGLHPLQAEAVAWISGGRDLLSATLALLTVIVYYRRETWTAALGASGLFVAALLAKPNVVVLPLIIVTLDWAWRRPNARRTWITSLVWTACAAGPVIWTIEAQIDHLAWVEFWLRPWLMLDTYAFYLRKILWPYPLSANYARTPDYVLSHARTLYIGLGLAAGVSATLVWSYFRDRRFWFGALWFLLLLPVSGITPFGYQKISTPADHYHYLPMLVVSAVVMLLFDQMVQVGRGLARTGGALVAVTLIAATCARIPVWGSNASFFTDMAAYNPNSYAAAIGMSIVSCAERDDFAEGLHWTEVALAARPDDISALANQAYCLLHAKNYIRVTELEYELSRQDLPGLEIKRPSAYASLLASIGTAEMELRQYDTGYQYLCQAFRIQPTEATYKQNLDIASKLIRQAHPDPSLDIRCDANFEVAPNPEDPDEDPDDPD